MQAAQFYQSSQKNACVIKLVSQDDWEKNKKQFPVGMLAQQFTGKVGDIFLDNEHASTLVKVYAGVGREESVSTRLTAIAQTVMRLPGGNYQFEDALSHQEQLIWSLSQYRYDNYKKSELPIRSLCLNDAQRKAVVNWAESIFLVRDLINTPAQEMGPPELAAQTRKLAKHYDAKVTICEGSALLNEGYGAIHAVGRGAATSPQLIEMQWGEDNLPLIVLVGKGVTFDTGGLDLKEAAYMRLMKKDMGGAAQVLGLANWIMASSLPIRLKVLIPAVENAIGPDSYRPGDIIRMRNGLTVEVDNTDAEGRLILADALDKACEGSPEMIIDFATLTGAARVAVGTDISAMFTNDDALATELSQASIEVNDPLWRLPLYAPYIAMLESSVANLVNSSPTSFAGAITAALFLQHFIKPSIPWVHFDLMAWNVSSKPGRPEGGEAMAIRAVARFLEKRFS